MTAKKIGRPRTRPDNVKPRRYYATDKEFAAIQKRATRERMTAETFVRWLAVESHLAANGIIPKDH